MDGVRLDDFARRLALSRRGVLRTLAGGLSAAIGGLTLGRAPYVAAGATKVGVCHRTGSAGEPLAYIEVAGSAAPAHEAHGDAVGVDLRTDAAHCGACGHACGAGQVCTGGNCCTPDCASACGGEDDGCGGACPAVTCTAPQECVAGACACCDNRLTGFTECGAFSNKDLCCSGTWAYLCCTDSACDADTRCVSFCAACDDDFATCTSNGICPDGYPQVASVEPGACP
jgi:hypothetical protein